jgi:hypothetical protein
MKNTLLCDIIIWINDSFSCASKLPFLNLMTNDVHTGNKCTCATYVCVIKKIPSNN